MEKDKRENRVAFVSLGPGDKDLVTIAALEALRGVGNIIDFFYQLCHFFLNGDAVLR